MRKLDKRIRDLSKGFQIPEEFDQRVEDTLNSIPEDNISVSHIQKRGVIAFACLLLLAGLLLFSTSEVAEASFLAHFKETIMDFFGIGEEESQTIGVGSDKEDSVSKPDLMIELQEKVIDSHNIYVVAKITAPANINFAEEISFDYFAFCKGNNYNEANLLSGAKECKLLEVLEGKNNIATYIVSLSTDEELKEGSEATVFFKDLMRDPYGDDPEMLVEGMWSVNFTMEYTVSEEVEVKGTPDMVYPFLDTTASLSELKLTPLGLTIVSDISNAPYDELGVSDTTIAVRLKMIDGSEKVVMSHDMEESTIISSGNSAFSPKKKKTYMTDTYQFEKTMDTSKVMGIYLEDCYVSVKEY